ncbi:hypothetical protein ABFS83_02G032500 [Erythranthe nasuta]
MGEYLKICESATMKSDRATEEEARLISGKKRKFYPEQEKAYCGGGGGGVEPSENSVSPAGSRTSDFSEHEDSSDAGKKSLRSPDLEKADLHSEGFETEISTCNDGVFSREATPTSDFYGDSEQLLAYSSSQSKNKSSTPPPRRKIPTPLAANMPAAAELEEFFAAAEKYEQKRFAEKYNFDIVNDVPLEGTYQWVRLQP